MSSRRSETDSALISASLVLLSSASASLDASSDRTERKNSVARIMRSYGRVDADVSQRMNTSDFLSCSSLVIFDGSVVGFSSTTAFSFFTFSLVSLETTTALLGTCTVPSALGAGRSFESI